MIFDFINKCKNLFASKKIYADNNINLGRASENLSANNTMVVGHDCDANGNYSTALGTETVVNYENQVVIGKYNFKRNSDYAFIIGNGTSDSDRSNALEVLWNGNLDVYRDLYVNGWIQSTKGIQSGQSIQSAIDVTCTGEGGVGTVSLRALNNNLANLIKQKTITFDLKDLTYIKHNSSGVYYSTQNLVSLGIPAGSILLGCPYISWWTGLTMQYVELRMDGIGTTGKIISTSTMGIVVGNQQPTATQSIRVTIVYM